MKKKGVRKYKYKLDKVEIIERKYRLKYFRKGSIKKFLIAVFLSLSLPLSSFAYGQMDYEFTESGKLIGVDTLAQVYQSKQEYAYITITDTSNVLCDTVRFVDKTIYAEKAQRIYKLFVEDFYPNYFKRQP